MGLGSVHLQLLRYFSLAKLTTVAEAVQAFQAIVNGEELQMACNADELTSLVDTINRVLKKYDLEILEGVDEINNDKIYCLINTADNHVTQKAKFYDKNTVQLFSKIVQACVMSESGKLSEIDCLNLNTLCEMTKSAAQTAILKLRKDKWFLSEDGYISLSMRSIMELESSIRQQYPDYVKNCPLCKTFLIQGSICADCRCKVHFSCLEKFFKKPQNKNKICPSCNHPWIELEITDQNASVSSTEGQDVTLTESQVDISNLSISSQPTPAKRSRRARSSRD